jgi:dephospho-CoA kinase
MIVIGLTGSIGMGKSTVASQFAAMGAKLCSADAIVHVLLKTDTRVRAAIKKEFPQAFIDGAIDRNVLGKIIFADDQKRKRLEAILHPRVQNIENRFVQKNKQLGTKVVVLDIPLLFETGGEQRCDVVIVASAPYFIQKQRVMRRPRMTEEKLNHIISSQMSDANKRRLADFVVATGLGKAHSFRKIKAFMKDSGLA